jgi:hypothetical protein
MNFRSIVTKRFCLALGGALVVAAVLVTHRAGPAPSPEGDGVIFVYFPSLCAAPGDSSNCREIPHPERPAFGTMAACSAYADVQLRQENNPRLMASCMKQREG